MLPACSLRRHLPLLFGGALLLAPPAGGSAQTFSLAGARGTAPATASGEALRPWVPSAAAAALVAPPLLPDAPALGSFRQEPDESPMAGMTGSGFFLGVIGMLGGAAVGSSVAGHCDAVCRRDKAAAGALVGGALFVPLGVHIANPEPGSMLAGTAISALMGAAMWGFVSLLPSDPMPLAPFLAAPIQLQGAIWAEGRYR